MREDEINKRLKELAFCFFYRFSRFEFALKENKYVRPLTRERLASPDWNAFVEKRSPEYVVSAEARRLVEEKPTRQVLDRFGELKWDAGMPMSGPELAQVVKSLKTVRNNLFHGGKHGATGWDDEERTQTLLELGAEVLDQLAELGQIEADYERRY